MGDIKTSGNSEKFPECAFCRHYAYLIKSGYTLSIVTDRKKGSYSTMAQSILDKINTLISANMHSMVDKALQGNSVAVMDEYVRQAEKNLDELEENIVTLGGSAKTLKRKYDEFSSEAEKIDMILIRCSRAARTTWRARRRSN